MIPEQRLTMPDAATDMELAQFVSALERDDESALSILRKSLDESARVAPRIGITGAAGAGKSSLIAAMMRSCLNESRSGVIAVDPSSVDTGGAMLGDRVRFYDGGEYGIEPDVNMFLRSVGSRGWPGALARHVGVTATLFEQAGLSPIILETSGAGQTDVGVRDLVDCLIVVLTPDSGDSIQMLKAGLLEWADIFVVNKADRAGSKAFAAQLRAAILARSDVRSDKSTKRHIHLVEATRGPNDELRNIISSATAIANAKRVSRQVLWERAVSSLMEEKLTRAILAAARNSSAWRDSVQECAYGTGNIAHTVARYQLESI